MAAKKIVMAFSLEAEDIEIISRHNTAMANPGFSASLRHILREWASLVIRVPVVGKVSGSDSRVTLIQADGERIDVTPEELAAREG